MTIIGARPQFIKAAAVSRAIRAYNESNTTQIEEKIIHTGQHFDANMSKIFFSELDIPQADYNLAIAGLAHGAMTGRMMEGIESILKQEQPDIVLVYGDTNSTLAGALTAKKMHIKVAHVEAGLRSFNMAMPEEINRILTDRISELLFCPTDIAVQNLQKEGFDLMDNQVIKCGDVMQDAALFYKQRAQAIILKDIPEKFILVTVHRAENTDNIKRLKQIVQAFNELSKTINIVMPLHPRTKKIIEENKLVINFQAIDPVGYLEMLSLLEKCKFVMTDSGGLQKEAFFFEKNCITLRDETEWLELVDNGYNVLVGADKNKIRESVDNIVGMNHCFNLDLYGSGKATDNILKVLME